MRSTVSICIVLAMAVCQTSGGPSAPIVWGLVLFPVGTLIISRRADRAVVEVEAPDSDDIVGEGELWARVLGGGGRGTGRGVAAHAGRGRVSQSLRICGPYESLLRAADLITSLWCEGAGWVRIAQGAGGVCGVIASCVCL